MVGVKIAVIGATGAVGKIFLDLLKQRNFPISTIRLCASERSWGQKLYVDGNEITVEQPTPDLLENTDIVFIAANSSVSLELAPRAVEYGALVIDKSSAFRMDPSVPLVVPEINGDDIEDHCGIIASPNCSTTPLVMALKPLNDVNKVLRVVVDTYQSVSGAGAAAMAELESQTNEVLIDKATTPHILPHQIAFNVLPHVERFTNNGYTTEEMKMVNETRKIIHEPDLAISATCVRVPVMVGHSEAVHIEFANPFSPDEVRDILSNTSGFKVIDDPTTNAYPTPIDAEGKDEVFAGRIRQDESHPNSISMWLVCDNLRKGAALNSIQIAEEVLDRELLTQQTARRT